MRAVFEELRQSRSPFKRMAYWGLRFGSTVLPSGRRQKIKEWFFKVTRHRPSYCRRVKEWGLNTEPRSPKVIVSLTSYPKRIGTVHRTIETLLTQTFKPDMVVLWLAESQFPTKEEALPKKLLRLKRFGLTIDWCEDLRSYKKLIPALRKYPDDIIVTADDDQFYRPQLLERLYHSYIIDPNAVHCHFVNDVKVLNGEVCRYSEWRFRSEFGDKSYRKSLLGGTGCLYPPHVLHSDVAKEELFQRLSPLADDLWFWAMAVLNGTKIKLIDNAFRELAGDCAADNSEALMNRNMGDDGENNAQLANILAAYPIVRDRVLSEGDK